MRWLEGLGWPLSLKHSCTEVRTLKIPRNTVYGVTEKSPQVERDSLVGQRCMSANWERLCGWCRHGERNPFCGETAERNRGCGNVIFYVDKKKTSLDHGLGNKNYVECQFLLRKQPVSYILEFSGGALLSPDQSLCCVSMSGGEGAKRGVQ